MSLISLVVALLLEQFHPLATHNNLSNWLRGYVDYFRHHFNAGERSHGRIAWVLAVFPLLLVSALVYWLLHHLHPLFAWVFCVLVLYLSMGFRRASDYFRAIQRTLREPNVEAARALLAAWRGAPVRAMDEQEVARVTIEEALLAAHHHVFGVIVWFVTGMMLGLGPAGAVLYRLALVLEASWFRQDDEHSGGFGDFAHSAYRWMEWLPIRLTAITFAIVGNFEDTMYCWRTQARSWPDPEAGIVLASGAGALGVILGQPIREDGVLVDRPELGVGDAADTDFLQSTVGLVWRALVLWMVILLLLNLAKLVGG